MSRYYLNSRDAEIIRETVRQVRGGQKSQRPVPTRRTPRGASPGNLIRATVDAPGGTSASTVNFDNAIAYVGQAPASGSGTFNNIHSETFADNAIVWLAKRKDDAEWEPDRAGGSSGSTLVYFELTQDKSYADDSKLAKPVDEDGVLDTGADAFHVVDDKNQFYGKAAAGGETGYRGVALKFTDDYNETGVPGYRIVTMEGPAHWMVVVLDEDYSMSGTDATPSTDEIWGRPLRDRRLPATGAITIHDDLVVAENAKDGEKWLVSWDEDDEHYIFVIRLDAPAPGTLLVAMITSTVAKLSAMDGTAKTATPGLSAASDAATVMAWSGVTMAADPDYTAMPAINLTKTDMRASTSEPLLVNGYIQTLTISEEDVDHFMIVGPFDYRSTPNFDATEVQLPGFNIGTDAEMLTIVEWIDLIPGRSGGFDQSIGHDASGATEWQDDTNDCPE